MKSGDAFGMPILGLSRRKKCWESSAFGAPTCSGALLLHLIYCEGPTPSSAWCCHLRAERVGSFCRHLVATEPGNQWPPCGRSSVIGLKNWFLLRCFYGFLWRSGFVSNKVHCTGQRKHSHSMHFLVTHSQRKQ